jgi:hypothetical protein
MAPPTMTTTLTDPVPGTLAAALRRSAELEAMIGADPGAFRILTGDRPTGQLHSGTTSARCGTGCGCRTPGPRCWC